MTLTKQDKHDEWYIECSVCKELQFRFKPNGITKQVCYRCKKFEEDYLMPAEVYE